MLRRREHAAASPVARPLAAAGVREHPGTSWLVPFGPLAHCAGPRSSCPHDAGPALTESFRTETTMTITPAAVRGRRRTAVPALLALAAIAALMATASPASARARGRKNPRAPRGPAGARPPPPRAPPPPPPAPRAPPPAARRAAAAPGRGQGRPPHPRRAPRPARARPPRLRPRRARRRRPL